MGKFYPDFKKRSGYILHTDFHLHPIISGQKSRFGLCIPPTIKITKTPKSVKLPPFSVDDSKVFMAKVKRKTADFLQHDEFSVTMNDPVVSGKMKVSYKRLS